MAAHRENPEVNRKPTRPVCAVTELYIIDRGKKKIILLIYCNIKDDIKQATSVI